MKNHGQSFLTQIYLTNTQMTQSIQLRADNSKFAVKQGVEVLIHYTGENRPYKVTKVTNYHRKESQSPGHDCSISLAKSSGI